jgi:D-alanyl-D-alanine carboxypeptidase
MTRTTYVNASGLPDDDQITTARDQALLGRAIQERFPRYYKYFSTASFVYHGEAMRNHNHLLGSIEGVDGIKTGFTRASGFNLLTSVHRDGRFIVAVVMGGHSSFERDAHMRELISSHIKEAALKRTVPAIAEDRREEAQPVAFAKAPMAAHAEPAPTAAVNARVAAANANDPIRPLLVRTITFRTAPVQSASLTPMPALVPVAVPQQAALRSPSPAAPAEQPRTVVASAEPMPAVQPAPQAEIAPVQAPAQIEAALPAPLKVAPPKLEPIVAPTKVEVIKHETAVAIPAASVHARGGWLIQIGAFDGENEAKEHLSAAQTKLHAALAAADPFTERVQKGDKALYRARFAGFDKATAEAACKQLKRSDFECMALKD